MRRRKRRPAPGAKNFAKQKEIARTLVLARLAHFAALYNLHPKKVFIKNQRSRWGSCSQKGNININYRIVYLRSELADYVVAHELCHLAEFNHSSRFWALLAREVPQCRHLRQELSRVRFPG